MNIVAVIPVRWYSTRFEGKALADLGGKPVLQHIIDNARALDGVRDVIVATTSSSQPIIDYCKEHDTKLYIGSEDDVLDRLTRAAKFAGAEMVLRLWGDNPLDPYAYLVTMGNLEHGNRNASAMERYNWNHISEFWLFPIYKKFIPEKNWSINTPEDLENARKEYERSQGSP